MTYAIITLAIVGAFVMGFLLGMEATTRSIYRATRRLSPPKRDAFDALMRECGL